MKISKIKWFIFILLFLFSSCFTLQPVEFKKADNITTQKTDSDFLVTMDLSMYNPNSYGIRLSDLATSITIDDQPLGIASSSQQIKLARKSDFILPVNAKASLADLLNLSGIGLNLLLGNKTATATIKGKMTLKKFIFTKKIEFEYKQKIDNNILKSLF